MMAGSIKIDGFGGAVRESTLGRLASELTTEGVPAESFGMLRRSEPGADGWIALIGDARTWLQLFGAVGGAIVTGEKVLTLVRLLAAHGLRERHVASVRVPYPWDDLGLYGASATLVLAPGQEVDAFRMWLERVLGVEQALKDIHANGHLPLANIECLLSKSGFRLRWVNSRGFERHEADYTVDGSRRGSIRDGWTETPDIPNRES